MISDYGSGSDCPVCLRYLSSDTHILRHQACHAEFCESCILDWSVEKTRATTDTTCPNCRAVLLAIPGGATIPADLHQITTVPYSSNMIETIVSTRSMVSYGFRTRNDVAELPLTSSNRENFNSHCFQDSYALWIYVEQTPHQYMTSPLSKRQAEKLLSSMYTGGWGAWQSLQSWIHHVCY